MNVKRILNVCVVALLFNGSRLAAAQADAIVAPFSTWDISDLLDHLPRVESLGLPGRNPESAYRFYVRPHLGDFVRRDFVRLPVGARVKLSDRDEISTELESYFTHGLKRSAGYGLSRLRLGAKHDQIVSKLNPIGWSVGLDYETPLSRPPRELSSRGHKYDDV